MPIKTSSAKAKGRKLQSWAANIIRYIFRFEDGDVESRAMGSPGVDIMLSAYARKKFPISIECKNTKEFPHLLALAQSRHNHYNKTIAAVLWHPPRKYMDESIIYFNFKDFCQWYEEQTNKKKVY